MGSAFSHSLFDCSIPLAWRAAILEHGLIVHTRHTHSGGVCTCTGVPSVCLWPNSSPFQPRCSELSWHPFGLLCRSAVENCSPAWKSLAGKGPCSFCGSTEAVDRLRF